MGTDRAIARVVGVLFIAATGLAIAGDVLLRPMRDDADYLVEFANRDDRVLLAVFSELGLAASVVTIAALLFPYLKRQQEGLALGYLGVRVVEGAVVLIGGMSSLLLLSLGRDYVEAGTADRSGFQPVGDLLLEARDWTDPLATVIVFGLSAAILYPLLYQSRLVPRWLSVWGIVGTVLMLVAGVFRMYGESASSTLSVVLTLPLGVNEMALAVWLIIKGFNNQPARSGAAPREAEPSTGLPV